MTGSTLYRLNNLSFTLQDGALRHLRLGDQEIIRQISFLVRDRDWGTIAAQVGPVQREDTQSTLTVTLTLRFMHEGAVLTVPVRLHLCDGHLQMQARPMASAAFLTNRAGFTVLHPIAGVAGAPARVTHGNGTQTNAEFPWLIDPWRPFTDIADLTYQADGLALHCAFRGDTFEMEDQRQWGDASFKTYNRSLDLPWPYELPAGDIAAQTVDIRWHRTSGTPAYAHATPTPRPTSPSQAQPTPHRGAGFAQTALLITAQDAQRLCHDPSVLARAGPQRLLCHVDAGAADTSGVTVAQQMRDFATLQACAPGYAYDLELICAFTGPLSPLPDLRAYAHTMQEAGFTPASVFPCPAVDRISTPPGSDWPACPPLAQVYRAARQVFASNPIGGGMSTFFPELNRKRPPLDDLDFVTHGLCPIVHAADDLSVMETLETLPHITRSAQAIASDRAYRIGPCSLAMRHNPYGTRTLPNPDRRRICLTDDDPRHHSDFGAAYALGLATQLAAHGVAVWTPAEVFGPRGIVADTSPLVQVLHALAAHAGQPVTHASLRGGIAHLTLADARFRANLTPNPQAGLRPYGCDIPGI
ncbi:hypothetical protein BFP70_09235 [Thioclava sp. SK-1]|uniref:hypothetical protein n=1 Tax=Thioclava sp. SK-1 TaxID=1889770 RepID=UPI00082495EC|nr:hypothetical protein [Thioclava sp. SK-1]OCX65658.1 hypothetical protein BFP70_09235 [Thioclava sp. SK-1]